MAKKLKCKPTNKEINLLYKKLIGKSRADYEKITKRLTKKYGYSCFRDIQKKAFRKIK